MRKSYTFLLLSGTLMLSACGYAVEKSHQDITFLSPEAEDSKCYVYIDKLKYQVFPPQTINIKKSEKDMEISCIAPGNRSVDMVVPAEFTTRAVWGTPAGMAWDYASQSLYHYPSVIAIDFTGQEITPNALPAHNNSDIRQPESYDLEEILATEPRLNEDKYNVETPLMPRGSEVDEYVEEDPNAMVAPTVEEKGDLQSVLDNLSAVPESDEVVVSEPVDMGGEQGDSEPVQLYPGQ